jgi:hypothetical protein
MMMKLCTMTSRKKLYAKLQGVISKRDGTAKLPSSVVEFSQNIIEEVVSGLEITELEYCCRPRTTVLGDLLLATGSPTKCERYPKGLVSLAASLYHEASFDWVGLDEAIELAIFSAGLDDLIEKSEDERQLLSTRQFEREQGLRIRVPTSSRINILRTRGEMTVWSADSV